jgi:RNA polymerase sigma-70 factor (sigma-E family)
VRAEEERQFREYVTGNTAALRRTAYLLCGDWAGAEDLVQDALCRLFVAWHRAAAVEQLHLYTRRILIRGYLSQQRRRRHREVPLEHAAAVPAAAEPSEDRLDLMAALAAIPPGQRAVLVLRFYDDLSVAETARLLNCSTGNVKSQTSRGLAALRGVVAGTPTPTDDLRRSG